MCLHREQRQAEQGADESSSDEGVEERKWSLLRKDVLAGRPRHGRPSPGFGGPTNPLDEKIGAGDDSGAEGAEGGGQRSPCALRSSKRG